MIGETKGHLGASLYAREILGLEGEALGPPPPVDLAVEQRNADFVRSLIEQGLVNAVHDVSDGGIACAVAEMALASGQGWSQAPEFGGIEMFAEDQHRYLIAITSPHDIHKLSREAGIHSTNAGSLYDDGTAMLAGIEFPLSKLREAHEGWLPTYMSKVD